MEEMKSLILRPSTRKFNLTLPNLYNAIVQHKDKLWGIGQYLMEKLSKLRGGSQTANKVVVVSGRRGRRSKTQPGIGPVSSFTEVAMPLTRSVVMKDPLFLRFSKVPQPIGDEVPGIRLIGRQIVCAVGNTIASDTVFTAVTGGATLGGPNSFGLSPDIMNGRVALIARNFAEYAYRYVRYIYVPLCSASTAHGFAMGYSPDAGEGFYMGVPTYAGVIQMSPSTVSPFWGSTDIDVHHLSDETFFTENDIGTSSTQRQTNQGIVWGAVSQQATVTITQLGTLFMEYVLDLYDPSPDYGFTAFMNEKYKENREEWKTLKENSSYQEVSSTVSSAKKR